MKKFLNFFKQIKRLDAILVFVVTILGLYAWYQLPQLVIRPDGFAYLVNQYKVISMPTLIGIEGSAIIWGKILPILFGTDMELYFGFELVFMLVLNALFYWMIKAITKNSWVASVAVLLFSVNYIGLFDLHSNHCYCWFMDRPINIVLLLPSFALLHLFLEKGVKKYYLISLLLYFIGVGGAHFLFFMSGLFFFYPVFWFILKEKNTIKKIRGFKIGFSYLGMTILFLLAQNSVFLPTPVGGSFLELLLHPLTYKIPQNMIMELVNWSQLPALLIAVYKYPYTDPISLVTYMINVAWITPYVLAIYPIVASIIYIKLPKFRALLIACILATAVAFYLNLYINHYYPLTQVGSNRYLYYPTFFLVIFWTLFLWSLYLINKKLSILIVGILFVYYVTNVWLIKEHLKRNIKEETSVKAVYLYIDKIRPRLGKSTLIVVPYPVGGTEANFFTETLGRGEVKVMTDYNALNYPLSWQEEASRSFHAIQLIYDKKCECVRENRLK